MRAFLGRQIYQFVKAKYTGRDGQSRENTSKRKETWERRLEDAMHDRNKKE